MADPASDSDLGPNPRVDDRILQLLSEHSGRIAFNGIRRALRVHPEALARALRRLEREGSVERSDGGYALREPVPSPVPPPDDSARVVASLDLSPHMEADEVFGRMAGRWFGRLRWVGVYERPAAPWLVWSVPPSKGHVLLAVDHGAMRVMVDSERGDPDNELIEEAARELLARALLHLRPNGASRRTNESHFDAVPDVWQFVPN